MHSKYCASIGISIAFPPVCFRSDGDVDVNNRIPEIHLIGKGAQMAFIVDISGIPQTEWSFDGLGAYIEIIFKLIKMGSQ